MAHADNGLVLPFIAASAIGQGVIAAMIQPASSANEKVTPAASQGWLGVPIGITQGTQASAGLEVAVIVSGVAKVRAAASIGAGVFVIAASVNGAAGPKVASGVASGVVTASAVQIPQFVVGKSLTAAAAGEFFACLVGVEEIF